MKKGKTISERDLVKHQNENNYVAQWRQSDGVPQTVEEHLREVGEF